MDAPLDSLTPYGTMSSYRVISLHRKPASVSSEAFQIEMQQASTTLETKLLKHPLRCIQWQASAPLMSQYQEQAPYLDWILHYDFPTAEAAAIWAQQLQNTIKLPYLWWLGQAHYYLLKADALQTPPPIHVLRFAKKKEQLSTEQFSHYWRLQHAPLALASPFLAQYEQLHLLNPEFCNGFTLSAFHSLEDLSAHSLHPAGQAAALDTQHFLHPTPQPAVITHTLHYRLLLP